jgi:hypothetical protein
MGDLHRPSQDARAYWVRIWKRAKEERRGKWWNRALGVVVPILALLVVAAWRDHRIDLGSLVSSLLPASVTLVLWWVVYFVPSLWRAAPLILIDDLHAATGELETRLSRQHEQVAEDLRSKLNEARVAASAAQNAATRLGVEKAAVENQLKALRDPTPADIATEARGIAARLRQNQVTAADVLQWVGRAEGLRAGTHREFAASVMYASPEDRRVVHDRVGMLLDYLQKRDCIGIPPDPDHPSNEKVFTTPRGREVVRVLLGEHQ